MVKNGKVFDNTGTYKHCQQTSKGKPQKYRNGFPNTTFIATTACIQFLQYFSK